MELVRLVAPFSEREKLSEIVREHAIVYRCADADTVMVMASLAGQLTSSWGVWLVVSKQYPAQLAARDLASLAALGPVEHAVIEARCYALEYAVVVEALLSNDEVNFSNSRVTLVGAYNRPAPEGAIRLWSFDQQRLVCGQEVLQRTRVKNDEQGEWTYFA